MRSAGLKSKIPWEKMFSSIIYGSKKYWRVIHSPVNFLRIFPWCCCGSSWKKYPKTSWSKSKPGENMWKSLISRVSIMWLPLSPSCAPQVAVFHEPAWFLMRPGLKNRAIAPGKNRSWRCGFPKNQCVKPNSNHPQKRLLWVYRDHISNHGSTLASFLATRCGTRILGTRPRPFGECAILYMSMYVYIILCICVCIYILCTSVYHR